MGRIAELKPELMAYLKQALEPHGFRRSHHFFYRKIPIGRQILHLAFIKHRKDVEVIANVDIRHDELEKMYHILLDEPPDIPTATIGAEFGRLSGAKSMVWTISDLCDIPSIGNKVLAVFWKVSWPFLEEYSSLESIYDVLVSDEPPLKDFCLLDSLRAEKALVAAYLLERKDNYDSLIDAKIVHLATIGSPNLKNFLEFAIRFRRMIAMS